MMRSVQRILAVFESFSVERTSLSLQELADRIDLPKSTAFRIVQSLEKAGYLVRLEDKQYCLSLRFLRLAGLVKSTLGIRDIARPIMVDLSEKTQEAISVHTVIGRNRVCIESVAAASTLRSVIQTGEQVPLVAGSATKVLLAYMSKKELTPLLAPIAKASKRPQSEYLKELEEVRKAGYAVSHGERLLGVSAISAPIMDVNEEVKYCLSLGGPSVRIQGNEKALTDMLVQAALEITRQFGGKMQ
ncbi:IclR family transcriptional regulator [Candidimonas sp. SYP-B2681]|uniref:IclR family transcriptional regulator n=1 Tax=Candidimonas sp. SYP-B2681 TaxID=2497686 RepID=UPI000F863E3B|nr:IclR family transcriptional regulator [Candidimonas sp. SYP-B2681]RTZ45480.1 IclR family transcriptional regulator [Candidimonas sp. SYP-B2681]